jgi:hypothetical protein
MVTCPWRNPALASAVEAIGGGTSKRTVIQEVMPMPAVFMIFVSSLVMSIKLAILGGTCATQMAGKRKKSTN